VVVFLLIIVVLLLCAIVSRQQRPSGPLIRPGFLLALAAVLVGIVALFVYG
jgi:hypothetical protein